MYYLTRVYTYGTVLMEQLIIDDNYVLITNFK